MDERKGNIFIQAVLSDYDSCQCDACHAVGRVCKIDLPETHYGLAGKGLTTEYNPYWLCDDCRQKLIEALQNPTPEAFLRQHKN